MGSPGMLYSVELQLLTFHLKTTSSLKVGLLGSPETSVTTTQRRGTSQESEDLLVLCSKHLRLSVMLA